MNGPGRVCSRSTRERASFSDFCGRAATFTQRRLRRHASVRWWSCGRWRRSGIVCRTSSELAAALRLVGADRIRVESGRPRRARGRGHVRRLRRRREGIRVGPRRGGASRSRLRSCAAELRTQQCLGTRRPARRRRAGDCCSKLRTEAIPGSSSSRTAHSRCPRAWVSRARSEAGATDTSSIPAAGRPLGRGKQAAVVARSAALAEVLSTALAGAARGRWVGDRRAAGSRGADRRRAGKGAVSRAAGNRRRASSRSSARHPKPAGVRPPQPRGVMSASCSRVLPGCRG